MPDRTAFADFVATRSQSLLRTSYLLTRDWSSAEDLLQTALAKAWFAWGRIEGDPEPYVRKIIVTTYASWWRRRWNGELATGQSLDLPHVPTGDRTAQVDDRDALWQALGRLPKRQRAVVVLRFFEDLTEAQTAEALGIATGTVKSQTSKALATLRIDASLSPALGGN